MSKKLILVGFLVEPIYFESQTRNDEYPQVAARKLEMGFLSGFLENGVETEVFGFFPSSTFPANPRILFGYKYWLLGSTKCHRLPFINFPGLKLITRTIALTAALLASGTSLREARAVCVYSTHTPLVFSANIIRKLLKIPFYVIIPDLPELMNVGTARGRLHHLLKSFESKLVRYLVAKSAGISSVTRHIVKDTSAWESIPSVVIEGIAGENTPDAPPCRHGQRPYFLYAGGLSEAYGVGSLLRAFLSSDIDAELWICGYGPLSDVVRDCEVRDHRIRHLGFLDQTSLRKAQINSIGLLITRDPKENYVRYSFPSKLIEYMTTGVPVITTRLTGIPPEYFNFVSTFDSSSENDIVSALKAHLGRSAADREDQGLRALQFIAEQRNPKVAVLPLLDLIGIQHD